MSGSLADIIGGYLDLHWRIHPVDATHAGRRELDGEYGRWDAASVREHIAALRSYTSALEEAPAESLDEEIDRTAVLQDARHELLVLERERPFAFNPAFHLSHALEGLFLLMVRDERPAEHRAAALLSRLRALPELLRVAREVLTQPARPLVALAGAMLPGGVALVRDGLDDPALDLSSLEPLELAQARKEAVDALTEFGGALDEMAERAAEDSWAIGRDLFDRKLHTAHLIRESADELLRYGERLYAEAIAELERIAAEISPGTPWPELVAQLRADTPAPGTVLEEYAEALRAARDFTVEHALMRVPPAELRVVATPAFLRALVPIAAYQGPGAFDQRQLGTFFVTLPEPGQPWRAASRAELPSTVVHEGVPGHHEQIVVGNALPSVVRRVIGTPATREGWAVYSEALMAEVGFLHSPAERLLHARHRLWRALRVVLDVSLHTKGMSVGEAARRLRDEVGLEPAAAAAEAARYCAYPTYQLCYAVGCREIARLRDDARLASGDAFSLAAFHDELLSYGALPTALARWGMGLA